MLAAAKAFSASTVAITDIRPDNLSVALQLGAQHALDQSQAKSSAETVAAIMAVFPEGPDIVIDCVGMSSTITVRYAVMQCVVTCSFACSGDRRSFSGSGEGFLQHLPIEASVRLSVYDLCQNRTCQAYHSSTLYNTTL